MKAKFIITEDWLNSKVNYLSDYEFEMKYSRIAYLISTSGSTGQPKIIEISHFSLFSLFSSLITLENLY